MAPDDPDARREMRSVLLELRFSMGMVEMAELLREVSSDEFVEILHAMRGVQGLNQP